MATARLAGEKEPAECSTVDAATSSVWSESMAAVSPALASVAKAHTRSVRSRGLNFCTLRSVSAAIACISSRSLDEGGAACDMCSLASAKAVLLSSWLLKWYSWRSASVEMDSMMGRPGLWFSAANAHSRLLSP